MQLNKMIEEKSAEIEDLKKKLRTARFQSAVKRQILQSSLKVSEEQLRVRDAENTALQAQVEELMKESMQ